LAKLTPYWKSEGKGLTAVLNAKPFKGKCNAKLEIPEVWGFQIAKYFMEPTAV